jgi:hypothetical protein
MNSFKLSTLLQLLAPLGMFRMYVSEAAPAAQAPATADTPAIVPGATVTPIEPIGTSSATAGVQERLIDLFADPVEGDQSAEDKPADAKPADDKPVEYELKSPDGLTLTDDELSGVKAKLAAAKVSPDQAQPLFDEWVAGVKSASESAAKQASDLWTNTQKEWQSAIKADPEIGGAKLDQTIATTRKGAETLLGTDAAKEFFQALNITGAGNNPAIVRAMHKAFSQHAPATSVTGTPAGQGAQRSAGATLYPTHVGLGNAALAS